jgi:hypothetical protein
MEYNNSVLKEQVCDKSKWTRQQHKIWYYLDKTQDSFWRIRYWPCWAQHAITLPHKNDSQMYNLFYFLIGNGLYQYTADEWIKMWDVENGLPQQSPLYKTKELQDMVRIHVKHDNGDLFTGRKTVFDMHLGRPMKM